MTDLSHQFRLRQSFKIAVAVVISALIVIIFHLRTLAFIAPISTLVIMTVFQYQTIKNGLQRIVGPALVTVISIVILNTVHSSLLYLFCTLVIMLVGGYLFAMECMGYAALMGLIIGSIIFAEGFENIRNAYDIGFYFSLQSAIGVVVAWVVTYLFLPISAKSHLLPAIANLYVGISKLTPEHPVANIDSFTGNIAILNACKNNTDKRSIQIYEHLIITAKLFYLRHNNLVEKMSTVLKHDALTFIHSDLTSLHHSVCKSLASLAQAIATQSIVQYDQEQLFQTISLIKNKITEIRFTEKIQEIPQAILFELLDTIHELENFSSKINAEIHLYNQFIQNKLSKRNLQTSLSQQEEQLFPINTVGLKKSIKITLTLMIMLIVHYYFGWYGGVQAIISATVVVAQPNLGRSQHKLILRFSGIVVGGIIGLIFLILLAHFESLFFLMALIFASYLVLSYLALSGEKYGYLGLQAAIIIPLILLTTLGPSSDFSLAWHRFIGVIQGGVIGFLIVAFVFPLNPLSVLRKKLANGLAACAEITENIRLRKVKHLKLRESIQSSINGAEQLIVDVKELSLKTNEQSYAHIILLLQRCFEELLQLCDEVNKIEKHPLLALIHQSLTGTMKESAQVFIGLEKRFIEQSQAAFKKDIPMKSFLSAVKTMREQKISKDYDIDELELYISYINSIYHILKHQTTLKKVINTL